MEATPSVEVPVVHDYAEFERAVGAWHEYHRAEPTANRSEDSLQPRFAAPAYTPTIFVPTTSTTYQQWGSLAELSPTAIVAHVNGTIKRCATSSKAFDHAISTLEITSHIFLAKQCPETSGDRADYLDALTRAQTAGQALYAPQQAYRDAISTFYVLATDIIDLLPEADAFKKDQKAKYNQIVEATQDDEDDVRTIFRKLTGKKSWGVRVHPLLEYMENARQRLKNWQGEEGQLRALAEESLGELL